ncbi:N,N-dimethylformamidase beta subunit family domain-containing protein [Tessaracoccus sp. MC1865]|uniref:N,N-dimethylformamidase beta subunit family domain-containing protein n=1 Tax=Tessaracoccus sp. MC1865 TaxID=2760310 RepID=UPI0021040F12|nr:N,N-dimethylformamidase beta subunit family domain-containing protein [Tessaracoccus sp. MC1865]
MAQLWAAPPSPVVAAPGDQIVAENQLPGSPATEWDVDGYGSDTIQGFATDISVNVGGTVGFKIDTPSTDYRIDIYRLGWYDGDGARKVATIDNPTLVNQPECQLAEPAPENLLDCGNWSPSASWAVPADAVSGIYIARPTREDVGGDLASHIPFIVRDDASTSEVFFQASTTTWQSYNAYGGYNLYGYSGTQHAHKVSFNRPFQTRGTEPENYLFNSEYPMLRWLERNGYDVSYTTNVDTARRGNLIQQHDAFLSVGHDEYWSQEQRDAVEAARDAGTNLAFFSANEVYWKIRWEDDFRTQVTYKEGAAAGSDEHYNCYDNYQCDPSDVWTGLWREAPGSTPENSLTGQISWRDDTVAMKVPARFAPLRFWRNTAVASLTGNAEATLAPGTVGYEWDPEQAEFNQYYPDGRILLSSTQINGEFHNMSLYRADSGALVFGAGTVQWPWGLDSSTSTPQATENATQQQATANLLADMGALPTSLQSGLVMPTASTDATGPTVTITTPAEGADLPGGTVNVTGTAADTGGVVAAVEISVDGGATWNRATGTTTWQYSFNKPTAGNITIRARAVDDSANLGVVASRTFGTADQVCDQVSPCSIFGTAVTGTQENDAAATELGMKFRSDIDGYITGLRFYKTTGNTGTHVGTLWTSAGVPLATVTFAGETATGWQQAYFDNPVPITANTTYVASYHAPNGNYATGVPFTTAISSAPLTALADGTDGANGVYLYGPGGFPTQTFGSSNYLVDVWFAATAVVGPDVTAPTVISRSPGVGATDVSLGANVTVGFSERLDPASVTTATVLLRGPGNVTVPAAVTWNEASRAVVLNPTESLTAGTTYSVTVRGGATGIQDLAGNDLAADVTWNFTTFTPPADRPDPNTGPGGPVLVVTGTGSHGTYLAEIMRAEGLNLFAVGSRASLTAAGLADYQTLVLGETSLTTTEVDAITAWVNAGGDLVAMRPDPALAPLLGLVPAVGTLANAYLQVDTSSSPGAGIAGMTMQFHGTADRYTAAAGTRVVAGLYSSATAPTSNPAVTMRTVGALGGSASAFTFDLAESVVLTRQGNPAWINQNRDGQAGPNRSNDLFYGGAEPDWVDLSRVAVPQADEQQRLLANLITSATADAMPLPRLWYLPRDEKAAIVMTSDNHNGGSVDGRFDQEIAASTPNCSVGDWECIRSTAYIYPGNNHMTQAQALAYQAMGFEIALHPNTDCTSPSAAQYASILATQNAALANTYPGLIPPNTSRNHCIAWIGWTDVPEELLKTGVNLDTNYYFWPPEWVANTPGMFTGSGFAQRFADADGQLIDVYQATTQMTDESGQSYPYTAETLMDRALGAEGYYGAFVANIHSDGSSEPINANIVAAAKTRGVPVITAQQLLTWTDGRNASSFTNLAFASGQLSFTIDVASGANGLRAMLPVKGAQGTLEALTMAGQPVQTTEQTIKGVRYAFFPAAAGSYVASYGEDTTAPVITDVAAAPATNGTAEITWATDEPATTRVLYGTSAASLNQVAESSSLVTAHAITLQGLEPSTTYYYRVVSADAASNSATFPATASAPLSFQTPGTMATDDTVAHFTAGTHVGTVVTNQAGGEVTLAPALDEGFSGTTVPTGWNSTAWGAGGGTTVGTGIATVDGAMLGYGTTAAMYGPGRAVEFVATFGADRFQHVGFGVDMNDVARWAIFSTNQSTNALFARTNNNGTAVNTQLTGSLIGSEHTYRIDWLAGQVVFWVDGVIVHTENVAITDSMRPVASDLNVGGPALMLDSATMWPPYATSGVFESRVHDAAAVATWGTLDYDATLPLGTSLNLEVRTGNTATPDGTWTQYAPVADGAVVAQAGRYLQYRATMGTTDVNATPVLRSVNLQYTEGATATTTTTTLAAGTPTDNSVELTATVTPNDAAGTVQFKNGATNIGAPVTVVNGSASYTATGLAPSTNHTFTATFTPANAALFTASTSAPLQVTTAAAPTMATDTTVAHFTAGTHVGTVVTNQSGGEVTLAPALVEGFSGTTVPTGWNTTPWTGGTATVAGGVATVDGALLAYGTPDAMYGPGRSIEFVATFGAAGFQHVGFGVDMNDVARWAIFSTNQSTNTLYARTNNNGTAVNTALTGSLIGSEHTYRIDWLAGQVIFWIDGAVVHTQDVAITDAMRPLASDYNTGGATVVVDSLTMWPPYVTNGVFESRIHDAGGPAEWGTLDYDATLPLGTSLNLEIRSGNTATPDATWTQYAPISDGAAVGLTGRYLQYRATLGTTDVNATPVLRSVNLPYTEVPPATATTTTLAASALTHNSVTLTANVAPTGAAGTVQFMNGTTELGTPVTVTNGTASYTATGLTPETGYTFTAVFTPTNPALFTTSTSNAVQVTTTAAPAVTTTTTLTAGTPTHNSVELTANVAPTGAAGTVQFMNGTTELGTPVTVTNGTATYNATGLNPETGYTFTAVFTPTNPALFTTSTSNAVQVTTTAAPAVTTTTTLAASNITHNSAALTATVTPNNAVGTVQFKRDGTNIGSAITVVDGTASYLAAGLTPETGYTFTAVFTPTNAALFTTSTSNEVQVTTTVAPPTSTTTTVTASLLTHNSLTLTAAVAPANAAGTVQFAMNGEPIGTVTALVNGEASLLVTGLAPDTQYTFTAVFTPTSPLQFAASTSAPLQVTTDPAPATETSTTLTAGTPTHNSVELTANVAPTGAAGTVQFMNGTTELGTPVTVTNGTASYTATGLNPETGYTFTAVFLPTNPLLFTTSTSSGVQVTTKAVPAGATSTALAASNVTFNSATLTATVAPDTAAGTVQFTKDGANIGSAVTVVDGVATYQATGLTPETGYTFTAVFTPTNPALFTTSTSNAVQVTTTAAPAVTTTTTLTAGTPTHNSVELTATVTPTGAVGTVQFMNGTTELGTPVTVTNGTASYLAAGLTPETGYTFTAVFTPTNAALFTTSTSNQVPVTTTAAPAVTTTTTLAASNITHNSATLTATVTPNTAVGTVQFRNGTTDIGSPVTLVNGTASYTVSGLTPSTGYTFTAVFTPTNPALFTASTSNTVQVTTDAPAPIVVTEVTAPTFADVAGTNGGTITIPSVTGVRFLVDGVVTAAGTHNQTAGEVTITAEALPGYVIADGVTTSWTHTFVDSRARETTTKLVASTPTQNSVLLTATVLPDDAVGTVQFRRGNGTIGAPVQVEHGIATFNATGLNHGTTYSFSAVFTPSSSSFIGSTSGVVQVTTATVAAPAKFQRTAPYTMPGLHKLNGREWNTICEVYSQTERCRTDIWATVVVMKDGKFIRTNGWAFNNLTYLPFMTREAWGANPLANTGSWTATDGRRWRTECDTANTGRNGCRSYALVTVYTATPRASGGYRFSQDNAWVFNNIVLFGSPAIR